MEKRLFKKYLRNYLCVLGIILILLVPIYITIYNGTEALILNKTYTRLEQEVADLDMSISRMEFLTDLLRNNTYVDNVANINEELVSGNYVSMMRAKEFLADCLTLSREGMRKYLMFRNNQIVIAPSESLYDKELDDYDKYSQVGMEFEEFHRFIFESDKKIQYLPRKAGDLSQGIICIQKGPSEQQNGYDIALIFEMDQEMMSQIASIETGSETDFYYVCDMEGEILHQVNYSGTPLSEEAYQKEKMTMNGQKYTLFQLEMEDCGLTWTVGVSNRTIEQGVSDVNWIIWAYFVISILCMIIFCIYWAVKRSVSMQGILCRLSRDDVADENIKNEYKYIMKEIEDLYHESERDKIKIRDLQRLVTNSILEKLLLRGVYSSKEKEELQSYLDWDMEFYYILCVNTVSEQESESLALFYKLDELLEKNFTFKAISMGKNERAYIVQIEKEEASDTRYMQDMLKTFLIKYPEVSIGISSIGTGVENVQLCYHQANLVLRQITDLYDVNIRVYCEQFHVKNKIFKLNLGNRIYDLIYAEEKDDITLLFDKIRNYALKSTWSTESEMMQFYFEIQNPVARAWDEMVREDMRERNFPVYESSRPMKELIDELEEVSYFLCDCVGRNRENGRQEFNNEILEFVENNYMKKEMCVSYAADALGISNKRFTILFKELTGKNFSTYVEARRMKEAEKYLLETDWSMKKIVDTVGYNSLDTFYKSFKRVYGLPPIKWREGQSL